MAMTYKDSRFEIQLPDGWRRPGFLRRLIFAGQPEFYGPDGASIKFAIGPISPEPTPAEQQQTLKYIATKRGEPVMDLGIINIGDREHATMTVAMPFVGRVKHYSIIFHGTEFFVSAQGPESVTDSILASFRQT